MTKIYDLPPFLNGVIVGIAVFSVHRLLRVTELRNPNRIPNISNTTRILDASHVSFAISKAFILDLMSKKKGA